MPSKKIFHLLFMGIVISSISGCYVCAGERIPLLKQKEIQAVFPSPSPK